MGALALRWLPPLGGLRLDPASTKVPTVKNALRPILRQLNNGPVSMKLDQPPAIDEPQQTGAAGTVERTMAAATEQGEGIPT